MFLKRKAQRPRVSPAQKKIAPSVKPGAAPVVAKKETETAAGALMAEELISGEELCLLTGFTDRWHRKVADKGYFPPPTNGKYKFVATLQGLFKYQRELTERSKESLAAKQELFLDKKIERAEHEIAVAKKDVLPLAEIADRVRAISEQQKSILQFQLDRLASINAGLPATDQRKNNRACLLAVCKALQEFAATLSTGQKSASAEKPL